MARLCSVGKDLLEGLQRTDLLPPFQVESVRQILEETNQWHEELTAVLATRSREVPDSIAAGLVVKHRAANRNKQLLLAYLNGRLSMIEDLRWEVGPLQSLPADAKQRMDAREEDYLREYDDMLTTYGDKLGVDIMQDLLPPRSLLVEVIVLEDRGEIMTESGQVRLTKNAMLSMARAEAEPLIRQGVVKLARR